MNDNGQNKINQNNTTGSVTATSGNNRVDESARKVISAGKPGSAGMVGSRRWMAAHDMDNSDS